MRDEADARACLAAMRVEGKTLYGWTGANDVSASSLYRWRDRLGGETAVGREVEARPAVRERLGRDRARDLLAEWSEEGGTLTAFCRSRGVSFDVMRRWRQKLASSAPASKAPRLVEVVASEPPMAVRATRYEIVVGDLRVVVGDDFADATLTRLVRVARAC